MEFDLYKIGNWQRPDWNDSSKVFMFPCSTLYLDLSLNPHPMATNILYAHFNELPQGFASWFYLNKDTIFLYEKLNKKYTTQYNHRSASVYYRYTTMEEDMKSGSLEPWKYRVMNIYICENCPLVDVEKIPLQDLHWFYLSINPHKCVIDFLKKHRDKIHWKNLARNPSDTAVDFLLEEMRNGWEIEWEAASINTNEKMIAQFGQFHFGQVKDQLNMFTLCQNTATSAVRFLLSELYERISWIVFCKNPNDLAVDHLLEILEKDPRDKRIYWSSLSGNKNPRIFPILEANQKNIKWDIFMQNPICFAYDYEKIRERFAPLKQEIQDIFLRPDNVMARIELEKMEGETDFDIVSRLDFN